MPLDTGQRPESHSVVVNADHVKRSRSRWRHVRLMREPYVLLPLIALLILLSIWLATLRLIEMEDRSAKEAIASASIDAGNTYEAQILRALREIDQALKLVKYMYEFEHGHNPLPALSERSLLPPDYLFVVGIIDSRGIPIASTQKIETPSFENQEDFQLLKKDDVLAISRPWRSANNKDWKLRFSRRLNTADGAFAGIVIIETEAAYFTSGYESSKMGSRGVLGLLGMDGIFRVRRTGEIVSAGDSAVYQELFPKTNDDVSAATLIVSKWDGDLRYISARQLYDFPLAVIAGLSVQEKLMPVSTQARNYLWRAAMGSAFVVVLFGMLARMSWQLSQSRLRAAQAKVNYTKQIEHLAYHDALTSLPNRSLFSKLLEQSIHQAQRNRRQLAVLFLDLDGFKRINDTLGHESGDRLLQEVSMRLGICLRSSDTVARLGGDEFVVLLPQLDEKEYAVIVANKILRSIALPFELCGQDRFVTASIGIAMYPEDGADEQSLKKHADIAMYRAKQLGKNRFQLFSDFSGRAND